MPFVVLFYWSLKESGSEKFVEHKNIVATEDYISRSCHDRLMF